MLAFTVVQALMDHAAIVQRVDINMNQDRVNAAIAEIAVLLEAAHTALPAAMKDNFIPIILYD